MSTSGIAEHLGITDIAFERFLRGEVPEAVARKIGSTAVALERFITSEASSLAIAKRLKCSEKAVQDLRNVLGREGAIGLMVGLCSTAPPT